MDFFKKALKSLLSPEVPLKVTVAPPEETRQAIRSDVTTEDQAWLAHLRASVDDGSGFATGIAMSDDRRLTLMQAQLDGVPAGDMPDAQAIGLGAVLGDMFAQVLELSWIVYEDESGRDLALGHGEHDVTLFPLSMILKRQVNREDLDISEMFRIVTLSAAEQIKDAQNR